MSSRNESWRRYLWLSLAVGGAAAGAVQLGRYLLRRPLPQRDGAITLAGLRSPVEVIRDRWGVPHIYAANEDDLFFAQGFVQAQDRLFQMDIQRRVGAGRISEIAGPSGILSDRFARALGWPRAARAQVAGITADADTRAAAAAFAAGVNAYIAQGNLPLEFTVLAYKPEPWQLFDSAAWATVLAWGLSVNWETELIRSRLVAALGPERAADLTPGYDDAYPTVVPDAPVGDRLAAAFLDAYRQAMANLPLGLMPGGPGAGSNNWVLSAERTTTGRPILANDPHLPPIFPTLWYESHLNGGPYNVSGFTMPGVPGILIGHNDHIAWGVTNAFPDIQDLYVERFHPDDPLRYEVNGAWQQAEAIEEVIKVRGRRQPLVTTVRFTRHGPIISDLLPGEAPPLALRWMCHDHNNHLHAVLNVARARDWDGFRRSLQAWAFPSQNVVYADRAGNIGYVMPGKVPLRAKGVGLIPVPGWTDEFEWQGWIPPAELPQDFNPASGYVVTANNRVTGADYSHLLTGEWLPPYRARRIADLIEASTPLGIAHNRQIQNDTVSLMLRRFVRLALAHTGGPEALPLPRDLVVGLATWDGDMDAAAIVPSIAFSWHSRFAHRAIARALGPQLAAELFGGERPEHLPHSAFHEIVAELSLQWLEQGAPAWIGSVDAELLPALQEALAILRHEVGATPTQWQWGHLHYVNLDSQLARLPVLGRVWKPMKLGLSGDGYTVNQADVPLSLPPEPVDVIASARMILDVGAWDNSISALPGGQSAHVASEHYQDSVEDWLEGRYHPMLFSRERIEAAAEAVLTLQPGDGSLT